MKPFSTIAAVLLTLVAVLHALRLWQGWSISVDSYAVPMWASVAGLAVAAVLAAGVWREARG
jgi:hypothetical protein